MTLSLLKQQDNKIESLDEDLTTYYNNKKLSQTEKHEKTLKKSP